MIQIGIGQRGIAAGGLDQDILPARRSGRRHGDSDPIIAKGLNRRHDAARQHIGDAAKDAVRDRDRIPADKGP